MPSLLSIGQVRAPSSVEEPFQLPIPTPIAIGAVFLVCLIAALWIAHHAQRIRGREDQVRASAKRLGMIYHGADAKGFGKVRFSIFGRSDTVNISHQSSGRTSAGTSVCSFDFSSAREVEVVDRSEGMWKAAGESLAPTRTRNVSTGTFASAAVADVSAYFPHLLVSPQNAIRYVVNNVTGADIKFESSDFNRMFQVTSDNEGFARLFLSPQVLDILTSAEGEIGLETFGRSVVLFGDDVAAPQLPGLALLVGSVVESLDHLVLREYPPPDLVVPGELRKPFLG